MTNKKNNSRKREHKNCSLHKIRLHNNRHFPNGLEIFSTYLFYDEEFESEFRFY